VLLFTVLLLLLLLQYDEMYKRSIEDPNGFWGDIAKEFFWKKQVRHTSRTACQL
jgi:hypothetical protein